MIPLSDEVLESMGFEYENDNGYACDWIKGSICIEEYDGCYIIDGTGQHVQYKEEVDLHIEKMLIEDTRKRINRLKDIRDQLKTP